MSEFISRFALFSEGILAGIFIGSTMLEHSARNLGVHDWISYTRCKDAIYGPTMPIIFSIVLMVSIVSALFDLSHSAKIASVAFLLIAGTITVIIHLPLNKIFQNWTETVHPANWSDARRRWRNWNIVRCLNVILSFSFTAFIT